MDLNNKNIIVTGATSGIGKLLTNKLFELGANVAFCGRNQDKMAKLTQQLASKLTNKNNYSDSFDATDFNKITFFVERAITTFGHIDVLINCAGANSARSEVANININDMQSMLNINMLSPLVFMQTVFNQSMKLNQQGTIVNVLSTVCGFSNTNIGAYTASKAGLDALTKVFRKEARAFNVKVCALYPGGVDTPFREAQRPEYLAPESVVNAILLMLNQSDNACIDELVIRPLIEQNYC